MLNYREIGHKTIRNSAYLLDEIKWTKLNGQSFGTS